MKKRTFIPLFISASILVCLAPGCKKKSTPSPNIIVILADDAGYADFGFISMSVKPVHFRDGM